MITCDTIAAIATPPGVGALGIVRMSGENAFNIADNIFFSRYRDTNVMEYKGYTLHYGRIMDREDLIDEVVMSIMRSPRSYTGENMVEFICHGSSLILSRVLEACLKSGARVAEHGEFTKRGFLNGKMDLSQAESVNLLINAHSQKAQEEALKIIRGKLRDKIKVIKKNIIEVKSHIDADIEWGDTENLKTMDRVQIVDELNRIEWKIKDILNGSADAKKLVRGFKVAICGKPNAGKSSLFNCILNSSRSIISRMPGTTRDVIESETVIEGYLINFVDTAGLGLESRSSIDKISMYKSKEEIKFADIIIYVIDGKTGIESKDFTVKRVFKGKKWIPVVNKCDLKVKLDEKRLKDFCDGNEYYKISCKKYRGLKEINEKIKSILKEYETDKIMITHRQREALLNAKNGIVNAKKVLNENNYIELISYELQEVLKNLGRIDGSLIEEDVLGKIFSEFCIGK